MVWLLAPKLSLARLVRGERKRGGGNPLGSLATVLPAPHVMTYAHPSPDQCCVGHHVNRGQPSGQHGDWHRPGARPGCCHGCKGRPGGSTGATAAAALTLLSPALPRGDTRHATDTPHTCTRSLPSSNPLGTHTRSICRTASPPAAPTWAALWSWPQRWSTKRASSLWRQQATQVCVCGTGAWAGVCCGGGVTWLHKAPTRGADAATPQPQPPPQQALRWAPWAPQAARRQHCWASVPMSALHSRLLATA